jgi:hypothetical protein
MPGSPAIPDSPRARAAVAGMWVAVGGDPKIFPLDRLWALRAVNLFSP